MLLCQLRSSSNPSITVDRGRHPPTSENLTMNSRSTLHPPKRTDTLGLHFHPPTSENLTVNSRSTLHPPQRTDTLGLQVHPPTSENLTMNSRSFMLKLGMLGGRPMPALAITAGCVWDVGAALALAAWSAAERLHLRCK